MEFELIKEKLKPGDIDTAAKMACLSAANGYKALKREGSKNHENMRRALEVIITKREEMITEAQRTIKAIN